VTDSIGRSISWAFPKSRVLAEYGTLQFLDDKGGKNVRYIKKRKKVRKRLVRTKAGEA
jgi:hypothetical protein